MQSGILQNQKIIPKLCRIQQAQHCVHSVKPYNHPKEYSNEFYWLSSGEINIYWLSPPDFFEDFSITSRGLGLVS